MSLSGDSQSYYKKRMDKWRSRSTRLFNRAQNLNRCLDRQLSASVKSMEVTRDVTIRRDQERIWMVAGVKARKYTRDDGDDIPAYLGKHMNPTLPTPQELSSLLPNKKAKQRTQSAGFYTQLSRRKLSTMSGDLNIFHYRKALESLRNATPIYSEVINETDGEDDPVGDHGDQGLETLPEVATSTAPRPFTAIPTADRHERGAPDQKVRPLTAIPTEARRKRRESVPNATALMIEQAQDPKNKVLRTNFLQMYQRQRAKHERRMSAIKEKRMSTSSSSADSPQGATNRDGDPRPGTAVGMISEEDEGAGDKPSGFMADTSASTMRRTSMSLRQRLRRTSLAAVSGMNALHGEVKSLQSFRKFKQESLGVLEDDIANVEDLEEGELFDEMRKCRYIRWGPDEERVIELNEDQPLVNQLKKLSIDTTKKPKRFLRKLKEGSEPAA